MLTSAALGRGGGGGTLVGNHGNKSPETFKRETGEWGQSSGSLAFTFPASDVSAGQSERPSVVVSGWPVGQGDFEVLGLKV